MGTLQLQAFEQFQVLTFCVRTPNLQSGHLSLPLPDFQGCKDTFLTHSVIMRLDVTVVKVAQVWFGDAGVPWFNKIKRRTTKLPHYQTHTEDLVSVVSPAEVKVPLKHWFESWSWWETPPCLAPRANQISTSPVILIEQPIHRQRPHCIFNTPGQAGIPPCLLSLLHSLSVCVFCP